MTNLQDFRSRIYGQYVHARAQAIAPATLSELGPRMPYLRQLVEAWS